MIFPRTPWYVVGLSVIVNEDFKASKSESKIKSSLVCFGVFTNYKCALASKIFINSCNGFSVFFFVKIPDLKAVKIDFIG